MIDLYEEVAKIGWASICLEINCNDPVCLNRQLFLQKEIVALCDRVREEERERCKEIATKTFQNHMGFASDYDAGMAQAAKNIEFEIDYVLPKGKKEI